MNEMCTVQNIKMTNVPFLYLAFVACKKKYRMFNQMDSALQMSL